MLNLFCGSLSMLAQLCLSLSQLSPSLYFIFTTAPLFPVDLVFIWQFISFVFIFFITYWTNQSKADAFKPSWPNWWRRLSGSMIKDKIESDMDWFGCYCIEYKLDTHTHTNGHFTPCADGLYFCVLNCTLLYTLISVHLYCQAHCLI